jgi:hypothetical protein
MNLEWARKRREKRVSERTMKKWECKSERRLHKRLNVKRRPSVFLFLGCVSDPR